MYMYYCRFYRLGDTCTCNVTVEEMIYCTIFRYLWIRMNNLSAPPPVPTSMPSNLSRLIVWHIPRVPYEVIRVNLPRDPPAHRCPRRPRGLATKSLNGVA